MRAPIFDDSKFAVLNKDLSGPFAWLRKQAILKRIETAQDKIDNLSTTMLSGNGLLDKILEEIKVRGEVHDIAQRRRPELAAAANKFAEINQKKSLRYPVSTTQIVDHLRALYAIVDVDQLKADFAAEFAGVETFNPNESIIQLDAEIELAESELKRVWPQTAEEFGPFFQTGNVPSLWEGRRVAPPGDPRRNQMASSLVEGIMVEFFGAWRARQRGFAQEVTLSGILIHTLPDDIRPKWKSLFVASKMETGNPVYKPLVHDTFVARNNAKPLNKMFDRSE